MSSTRDKYDEADEAFNGTTEQFQRLYAALEHAEHAMHEATKCNLLRCNACRRMLETSINDAQVALGKITVMSTKAGGPDVAESAGAGQVGKRGR